MLDIKDFESKIINSKKYLRSKSKNFRENFKKIQKYINKEVQEVETLIKNNSKIIPEINFNDLTLNLNKDIINSINLRGCVVIRDVFDDNQIQRWNKSLENYIEQNNYYDDQKEKVGIDQYFSELKSGKPQIFGLYWSKTQIEIRQSNQLDAVKKWLNNIWHYSYNGNDVFDPNRELVYADRVRRREPGDTTLGLSPHCDAGSIERWIDKSYQKVYDKIFSDQFEKYNPFEAQYRDQTKAISSAAVSNVFRTFQGWVALTRQGPSDGTLQLIPIAKAMAYILTRTLLEDVAENDLCGSKPGRALLINQEFHSLLLRALVSIPLMNPGDTVWWHPDVVHAVEEKHEGDFYSNVVYVGSSPYCKKNMNYAKKQANKFLEGKSPPDFAPEDFEINYKGRATIDDLTELGKKQLALEDWN